MTNNDLRFIYGGSFDPPHRGHFNLAKTLCDVFAVTHFSFMPCATPALKSRLVASDDDRIAMLGLMLESDPRLNIDLSEIQRGGVSYTQQTLAMIRRQQADKKLVFVMGLDALMGIRNWYNWQELVAENHLLVVNRPSGDTLGSALPSTLASQISMQTVLTNAQDQVSLAQAKWREQDGGTITFVPDIEIDISSTMARQELAMQTRDSLHLSSLVCPAVLKYIIQQGLYRPQN